MFASILATGSAAAAQSADTPTAAYVETTTLKVDGPVDTKLDLDRLKALDEKFKAGKMTEARAIATAIIDAAKAAGTIEEAYDYTKNYLALVWVAADAAGKLTVRRLVVPQPVPRPYALDLPGVTSNPDFYELFVAGDRRATLVTVYRSTQEENPLVRQIPTIAAQILGPLFGLAAGVAGEILSEGTLREMQQRALKPTLHVTASRVVLPFRRATVQARSVAYVPKTLDRLRTDVDLLAATARLKDAAGYPCAQAHADRLKDTVMTVADQGACRTDSAPPVNCMREFDTAFNAAFAASQKLCTTPSDDETRTMKAVDGKFRDFVLNGADQVTSDITFRNQPLTHFSLAAVTGLALKGSMNKPRVKLDDQGVVVADPLGRVLTMIAFNWSPRGYDTELFEPSTDERYRVFAGAIITPDFGVGGGLSVLLVRGLAVNVGGGVVFGRAVESEEEIGKPPANAKDPFVLGRAPVLFVGASFNLK